MAISSKTVIAAAALALLWLGEIWAPFYMEFRSGGKERLRHDARNLSLGLLNASILAALSSSAFAWLEAYSDARGIGLLRWLAWPPWLATILAFVAFDFWMYLWHRANHVIPFLWRFHRTHHSDPEMDVTTGVRFHPGEACLSAAARLAVLAALGLSLWQVALYEAIFLPVVLFHHSNVRLPRWLDRGLLALIVSPVMHRVHHSRIRAETDSNYGSVFPYWDMLLRTFRLRDKPEEIHLGLEGFDADDRQTFLGLLRTPWPPDPPRATR
jgi:sterol desaturase/sphingolipid hydroxylase (fatty acid hydroxylase superfamily)